MKNITTWELFELDKKKDHLERTAMKKKLNLPTEDSYDGTEKIAGYDEATKKKLSPLVPEMVAAFSEFIENKDVKSLETALSSLEDKARKLVGSKNKDAGLWWRFFKGDTGANDKAGVCRDIRGGGNNRKYAIEQMEIAVGDPKNISLYFS